jgi:hypothetical protein
MFKQIRQLREKVYELETELKCLKKSEFDYHTNTLFDYLIGDDMNCPICGCKMSFNTETTMHRHFPVNVRHTLTCPIDKFTVSGNSLKECIDQLNTFEVVKIEK